MRNLAQVIDHTLLKPEATAAEVATLVDEGVRLGVTTICVAASMLPLDARGLRLCAVCGFPSGAHMPGIKAAEAANAVANGADEVDMVINLGLAKAGDWAGVQAEIQAVRDAVPGVVLKVIIESAALTDDEITHACNAAEAAEADFVKTSTGFHPAGGASVHAVQVMKAAVGDRLQIKASGGIRTLAQAEALIAAGAMRLGLSATAAVLAQADDRLTSLVQAWLVSDPDANCRDELTRLARTAGLPMGPGPTLALTPIEAKTELADRFDGSLQFGTAGLRGVLAAGPNRMNRAVALRAAKGLIDYLTARHIAEWVGRPPRVVIGNDARHHSREFAVDTAAVVQAAGGEALLLPTQLPTPVLAFAVRQFDADAGVMVTASHNPAGDNGYKVYLGGRSVSEPERGAQIVWPDDERIAAAIEAVGPANTIPRSAGGWTNVGPELLESYLAAISQLGFDAGSSLPASRAPIRIVHTAMHGVGSAPVLESLRRAGFADVVPVPEQQEPDPDFPTAAFPNPQEPGALVLALALAQDVAADLVIASDPDADRCAVAVLDPHQQAAGGWRMLSGDELGVILGMDVLERLTAGVGDLSAVRLADPAGVVPIAVASVLAQSTHITGEVSAAVEPVLVSSVVSSQLLGEMAKAAGVAYRRTLTGFKWMSRVPGLAYAYEEAIGYCVRPDLVRDKDGLSAGIAVARIAAGLKSQGKTVIDLLDDLARRHGLYLTSQISARFTEQGQIAATVQRLRDNPPAELAGSPITQLVDLRHGYDGLPPTDGLVWLTAARDRVIIRPSGTEPKLKCYLEVIEPVEADASFDMLTQHRFAAQTRLVYLADELGLLLGFPPAVESGNN